MRRVLFVTNLPAPFWLEFSREFNMRGHGTFTVASHAATLGDRGKHWLQDLDGASVRARPATDALEPWLSAVIAETKPGVVIAGSIRDAAAFAAARLAREAQVAFGQFGEQPSPGSTLAMVAKRSLYRVALARTRPRFLLSVGQRAVDHYARVLPPGSKAVYFPYYQDLSGPLAWERGVHDGALRFLFSGRLIARNAIREMLEAFTQVVARRGATLEWLVSASGPEETVIREAMQRNAELGKVIRFDREFDSWQDRLRPFRTCDVLLVPAKHSGWGLVVPEALAHGMPVISTYEVEAARHLVEDGTNGLMIRSEAGEIAQAIEYFLDHPDAIGSMAPHARAAARRADVAVGAARLASILEGHGL